ncbi:MAG: preprotein translocase subunit YajC [Legionellales bacterium]|nr:preprotein translocase subunit YajC [Legionellales bacterium]|tara:strand:+ start:1102 stop:1455 length:354 start_codon:yes stop_codon:yes gene_type:complete
MLKSFILLTAITLPFASAAGGDQLGDAMIWNIIPIAFIGVLYFLFIRPQQQAEEEQKKIQSAIKVKDEIVTNFGILGKVIKIKSEWVKIDIGQDHQIWIQKKKIKSTLPHGTMKSLD